MRLLWSNFCIHVFVLLFSCSIFSDRRSLKIENENNGTKALTVESPYTRLENENNGMKALTVETPYTRLENENNGTKALTVETPYTRLESLQFSL